MTAHPSLEPYGWEQGIGFDGGVFYIDGIRARLYDGQTGTEKGSSNAPSIEADVEQAPPVHGRIDGREEVRGGPQVLAFWCPSCGMRSRVSRRPTPAHVHISCCDSWAYITGVREVS